jgi:hypothetical protein
MKSTPVCATLPPATFTGWLRSRIVLRPFHRFVVAVLALATFSAVKMSAQTVNDTDTGIVYTGTWSYSANRNHGDYQNDVHDSKINGDSASYTFTGTGISYVTETNTDEGNISFYLDGVFQRTVSCLSSTRVAQVAVFSASGLASGSHTLKAVKVDGTYMLLDALIVTAPTTTYTITASAGSGGMISPSGAVTVNQGANQTFTITANSGNSISSVTVDGANVGAVSSYTFSNVQGSHTISASFVANPTFTITASAGANGSISPSGSVPVAQGASQTFTITANSGFAISDVAVDGTSVGAVSTYAFSNVQANHTISASFAANSGVTVTVATGFYNQALSAAQTGTFTATWDASPSLSPSNSLVGLSQGSATAYTGIAVSVRFNPTGDIDARNGGAYAALSTIPYSANTTYHFRVVVNVPAHTYSAYVTPPGGSEITIGTNYAFRTEQAGVTQLDTWNADVNATPGGSITVSNVSVATTAQAAAPTFSPSGGTYSSAPSVSITTTTGGASIRYTLDGSTPTSTSGTLYTGPVVISSTSVLKAVAYASGMATSSVTSATYTIGSSGGVTTTGTISFHLLLGVSSSQDSLTLTGDNYTDLIMSNTIAGVMYGHLVQEYYPGIQFNKDYLYGSLFGQLLQENLATQLYTSSSNLIDPSPDQQAVMGAGQGGPYQINNYAIDMVSGSYTPAGHSLINYIAIQKNIGFTMANASTQYSKPTPPSFNNKYYGPMPCAFFHYNDLVALNIIGKGPGGWTTPWQPAFDQAMANFVNLPNSFLDVILNVGYNQGFYGTLEPHYCQLGATATASTVASVNSYSSTWGSSDTYQQYPYQVHYYLDQLYDNPIPTTSPSNTTTPTNHVAFSISMLSTVFSNVAQTLSYSNGTNAAQFFTAAQAQSAFSAALSQYGVSSSATLDFSRASDRTTIYNVIDSALGRLETTGGMKFNSTTNNQL